MSDYQADWERKRSPCHKCAGYRENSLGMRYCWRYREVQAAGGITLDTRHPQVLRKKGGTWKGKYKVYWPFDYEPVLIVGGCPALLPKGPYCQVCADIFHMDSPNPVVKCSVCGRDGNACENCGGVFEPDEFTWCGPREYRMQLCKGCLELLEAATWGGPCQSCGQYHEKTRTVEVFYPWPLDDEYWRLCPACGVLLAEILNEGRERKHRALEEQDDPDEAILCANCEDWYPPDAMTQVEEDFWLCPHCMEEAGYEAEEDAGNELHGSASDDPTQRAVSGQEGAGTAAPGESEDVPEEPASPHARPDPDELGGPGAGGPDLAGERQASGGEGGGPEDRQGTQEGLECGEETAAAAAAGVGEDGGEAASESHPCQSCKHRKAMNSKFHGKRLGYPPGGKCTRAGGFCGGHPDYEPPGKPKHETMAQLKRRHAAAMVAEQEAQA